MLFSIVDVRAKNTVHVATCQQDICVHGAWLSLECFEHCTIWDTGWFTLVHMFWLPWLPIGQDHAQCTDKANHMLCMPSLSHPRLAHEVKYVMWACLFSGRCGSLIVHKIQLLSHPSAAHEALVLVTNPSCTVGDFA